MSCENVLSRLTKLKTRYPHVQDYLFSCPYCGTNIIALDEVIETDKCCLELHCSLNTFHKWYACSICPHIHTHFKEKRRFTRHLSSQSHQLNSYSGNIHHHVTEDLVDTIPQITEDDDVLPHEQYEPHIPEETLPALVTEGFTSFDNCTHSQAIYFRNEHKQISSGLSTLVARSLYENEYMSSSLNFSHLKLHINLTAFLSSLTHDQRLLLLDINKMHEERFNEPLEIRHLKEPPTLMNQINARYCLGVNSISKNLPCPTIKSLRNNHSYVSLIECIADLLGHSESVIDEITPNIGDISLISTMSQSSRAQEILQQCNNQFTNQPQRHILYLIEWSDDFEPSSSIKDNRGGAWMKTITISPKLSNIGLPDNTYVIAIGPSGESHEEVEGLFSEELQKLRSGNLRFYNGKIKQNILIYADILVSLQDSPERRKINCLMLGSGSLTPRWGHVVNCHRLNRPLPSCNMCRISIHRRILTNTQCPNCFNWDTTRLSYSAPTNYPSNPNQHDAVTLSSQKITYDFLITGISYAQNMIIDGNWSTKAASAYIQTLGINTSTNEEICKNALSIRDHRRHNTNNPSPPIWKVPSLWLRGVPLSAHIDAPMHLLFLGIVKASINLMHDWATNKKKTKEFIRSAGFNLHRIKSIHLSWCKVIPYSNEGTTGWISENYVAISKIFPWFFSSFLFKCVPLGEDRKLLVRLVTSLRVMLARVMDTSMSEDKIIEIERHIKIFLSCYDDVDKLVPVAKPRWLQKSNFLCLLNIPDILRCYGPIRNYWEGSCIGEKMLQQPKGMWYGFTLNWSYNMLRHITLNSALGKVRKCLKSIEVQNNPTDLEEEDDQKPGLFRRYTSIDEVKIAFREKTSLSCVVIPPNNRHGILIKTGCLLPITIHYDTEPVRSCGDVYFKCTLASSPIAFAKDRYKEIQLYCLMLPMVALRHWTNYNICTQSWTFVTSEWLSINEASIYEVPKLHGITY